VREPPPSHVVGVFQDASWARRGLDALARDGFPDHTLSIIASSSDDTRALFADFLPAPPETIGVKGVGPVLAGGPLLVTLQGADAGLTASGLGGSVRRAGFQPHDGQIFQALLARGGVLVGVLSEPRAADALARLHSYGAGNAGIGAWGGRV
jgi:hypothetical protein